MVVNNYFVLKKPKNRNEAEKQEKSQKAGKTGGLGALYLDNIWDINYTPEGVININIWPDMRTIAGFQKYIVNYCCPNLEIYTLPFGDANRCEIC